MPPEAHLAIALLGLLVGLGAVTRARRGGSQRWAALLYFVGFGTFIGASLNAMDAADLSDHARGLWIEGVGALVAGVVSLAAHRPHHRRVRGVAILVGLALTTGFVVELIWHVDVSAGFFGWLDD